MPTKISDLKVDDKVKIDSLGVVGKVTDIMDNGDYYNVSVSFTYNGIDDEDVFPTVGLSKVD